MIRKNQQILISIQKLIDLSIMFVSIILAFNIRFYNYSGTYLDLSFYVTGAFVLAPLYLWVCISCKLYKPYRTGNLIFEFIRIVEITLIITATAFIILFLLKIINVSRLVIVLFMIINIVLLSAFRFSLRIFLRKMRARGYNVKYILLIGESESLKKISNILKEKDEYGYAVTRYRGEIVNLWRYLEHNLIDEIFVSVPANEEDTVKQVYDVCEKYGIKINIIPSYAKYLSTRMYVDEIVGVPIINVRDIPLENLFNRFIKRVFDIIVSGTALVIFSPVFLIISFIIAVTSRGPVIYKQKRTGLNRKSFYMYKFRSMSVSNQLKDNIKANEEERCTPFGKFIRKYKLDELPQFVNVLKGDMSIVGPRPEITTLVKKYKEEIPEYMLKHQVKCGMTGLAQVNGYNGDTSLNKRIKFDNEYIEKWNIWLDIKIVFLTVPYIFKSNKK